MTTESLGVADFHMPADFAFFEGGPLRPVLRRLRARAGVSSLDDRAPLSSIAACFTITWLPLLALSLVGRTLWSGTPVPFARDVEAHARFIVALPLLLAGNRLADRILPLMLESFVKKEIVRD